MAKFFRQLVFFMWRSRYYTLGFHFGTVIQYGNLSERQTGCRNQFNMYIQLNRTAIFYICVNEAIVFTIPVFETMKQCQVSASYLKML